MSPLNARRAMDARWPLHHRSVPRGWQPATILIARPDGTDTTWDPVTGVTSGGGYTTVYWGQARLVPNKDWRARRKRGENSPMVQHAVRIQAPIPDCPPILTGDVVRVFEAPYDDALEHYIFHVRNPVESSNTWGRSVLADVDTTANSGLYEVLTSLAADEGWEGGS